MFGQVSILAPGLLGGSLGLALHAQGLAERVVVWARRPEQRVACAAQSWCAGAADTPEAAVAGADLVVVCTPVDAIVPLIERLAPHFGKHTLVTDVGSTKSLICRHARFAIGRTRTTFVGSHPMAGSERSGLDHAQADLFAGAPCFVTPLEDDEPEPVRRIVELWHRLGCEVITSTPEKHDEIVAHISHLPHVVASVLGQMLGRKEEAWARYAGNGLKDTTRVAAGSPTLWKSILTQNRDEVVRALGQMEDDLHRLRSALINKDDLAVLATLERGKVFRDQLRPRN